MTDLVKSWQSELAPAPKRLARATLIAVLCGLLVIISKSLSLPETALSAYLIFFVSKEDSSESIKISIALMVAVLVAFALFYLLVIFSAGEPLIRILVMFSIAFGSMYVANKISQGAVVITLGMVFFELLSSLDFIPFPSLVVRGLIWIIPIVLVPMAMILVANILFGPLVSIPASPKNSQNSKPTPLRKKQSSQQTVQFAIKGTLSIAICYGIFIILDWPAIHTITITAFLVSLGSTEEALHKSALRLTGGLIGAVISLFSLIVILPHLTHAADLAVLTVMVAFPAAWISVGSEKYAYLGMQIALVFFLCVLNTNGPSVDVGTAWGRIVGIILGNLVVATVYLTLWPDQPKLPLPSKILKNSV